MMRNLYPALGSLLAGAVLALLPAEAKAAHPVWGGHLAHGWGAYHGYLSHPSAGYRTTTRVSRSWSGYGGTTHVARSWSGYRGTNVVRGWSGYRGYVGHPWS